VNFKEIVEILQQKNILCKELKKIDLKKRKISLFQGVDLKDFFCCVVVWERKSKFLTKDIETLNEILPQINFRYKKKILLIKAQMCKKTKEKLKDWRIIWY
jgi:hypothetical protein